jgi:hypothetical protein
MEADYFRNDSWKGCRRTKTGSPSIFQRSAALNNSQHVQDDEDDSDNEQGVDPAARLREAWADVPAEVTKQPEDY